jgi:hypothetical protein
LNSDRKDLPELPGQAGVVTYSRLPGQSARPASVPPGRVEPRLTATEVPFVAVRLSDAIGGPPDLGAAVDPGDDDEVGAPLIAPRRPRWLGLLVVVVVIAAAAVIGVLASSFDGAKAPVATVAAPLNDKAAEILSLRQQIEDVARKAAESAEDARTKTAELQRQLAKLEQAAPDAEAASADDAAPKIRDVTDTAPLPAPVPQPLASANGTVATPADVAAEPTAVAVVPPVPRVRPDPATVEVSTPAAGGSPVAAGPPAADDSTYIKSIERILADAPPDQRKALPSASVAPLPVPLAGAPPAAASDATLAPGNLDDGGPIPPEPIPNPPPDQGGVQ